MSWAASVPKPAAEVEKALDGRQRARIERSAPARSRQKLPKTLQIRKSYAGEWLLADFEALQNQCNNNRRVYELDCFSTHGSMI